MLLAAEQICCVMREETMEKAGVFDLRVLSRQIRFYQATRGRPSLARLVFLYWLRSISSGLISDGRRKSSELVGWVADQNT